MIDTDHSIQGLLRKAFLQVLQFAFGSGPSELAFLEGGNSG
jgi:hypothetical protein